MDVLTNVLQWLRVKGSIYARAEMKAPWGVIVPPSGEAIFHVIDRGGGVLEREGHPPLSLAAGDLVVVQGFVEHVLKDSLETKPVPLEQFLEEGSRRYVEESGVCSSRWGCPVKKWGGEGVPTTMYCGSFSFEGGNSHPLLSLLPAVIHISHEEKDAMPWLDMTLRFMGHESCQRQHGADAAISRLVDLLFIQIIRTWISTLPEGKGGWMGALNDPQIGESLRLIHDRPEESWTVETLAKSVGMSRSGFSARFQSLVEVPPLKYLTRWRMHVAAVVLKQEQKLSVEQVAHQIGYDSIVSFSRAFKRHYNVSPGAWRQGQESERASPELIG